MLPEGIQAHLSAAEMDAVIAHELCHFRRRDNLTAAIHMLVEALFWFHPLVWWLGARLVDERERACDESVVEAGADPQTYAEGILKVCRLYLQSPLACAAGVSGANLKKRLETIMTMRARLRLTTSKKLLLASAVIASLSGPLAAGLVPSGSAIAQPQAGGADDYSPDRIAQRRAEQAEPRKAAPSIPRRSTVSSVPISWGRATSSPSAATDRPCWFV